MKLRLLILPLVLLTACQGTPDVIQEEEVHNVLTEAEERIGWRLLFDGETLDGWRGFKRTGTEGWAVDDQAIARVGAGGDLVTVGQFENFILELEWKVAPGGNSGIFYGVEEEGYDYPWQTGAEMQVLDNALHQDGRSPFTSAGANYALHAPPFDVTKPAGEWNHVRLEVRGQRVVHALNKTLLFEFERWTPEWEALVEASKFSNMPGYGRSAVGHLSLQDHGDPVWFRNIKILELD